MKTEKMPNITLSMTKEDQDRLKGSAKKHRRSVSQQVIFLLDEYEQKQQGYIVVPPEILELQKIKAAKEKKKQ